MKKDHYLLDTHGIHPSIARKTYKQNSKTWVIELKTPRVGTCPSCGKRSRRPKEHGIEKLQGLGNRFFKVEIRVPWVRFYCVQDRCLQRTFRFRVLQDLGARGKTSWPVTEVVEHLSFEESMNNLEIKRLLWTLFGVEVTEPTLRRILKDHQVRTPQDYAPGHLGIDEYFPKGQSKRKSRKRRARLMLLDLDLGVVIAQVRGLDKKAALRLFQKAKRRCDLSRVKTVTRDLCEHWDGIICEQLGRKVSIRVDRFHLIRNLINELYTKIYAPERMQLREEGYLREARELFVNRYRFRKRRSRLIADDEKYGTAKVKKLDAMLMKFPHIAELYELKEDIFELLDLGPGDGREFNRRFRDVLNKAIEFNLIGLVQRLNRHRAAIRSNILKPPTPMLPEQCFVSIRASERRRKGFRTEYSRERYYRAMLRSAIRQQREAV
jgi:hypothetical protein